MNNAEPVPTGGLQADSHVHTQWSWDASAGDMVATCEQAVRLGVPAVAFTEHVDHTVWQIDREAIDPDGVVARTAVGDTFAAPPFDVEGYLASVQECRDRFPGLRILTGAELGEPHRHPGQVDALLRSGELTRVLGSVHNLPVDDGYAEPRALYRQRPAPEVMTAYLQEVATMAASDAPFQVLAHVDYGIRAWPDRSTFDVTAFEEPFRHALRALADSGRALEVNTRIPLPAPVLGWWRDEGGQAITFGSDAHHPDALAHDFRAARHLAEATGFRPGRSPEDLWGRA